MASRKISDLDPGIQARVNRMIEAGREAGFSFLIYCTYRDMDEQARLYRQGRTLPEIQTKADELDRQWNRPDLSEILLGVGPQKGTRIVTNAGPGQSLHNYRLALDGCPMMMGKPVWDESDPLWETYGEMGMTAGFEWAGTWRSFKEFPHLQAPDINWRDLIQENR